MPPSLLISPSRIAKRWIILSHSSALLLGLSLPWGWMTVAFCVVILSMWRLRWSAAGPQRLDALPDGSIRLSWLEGQSEDATLLPASCITGWLTILQLQLQLPARRLAVVLWPDSAAADCLRQWRVWLRWHWPALQRSAASVEEL